MKPDIEITFQRYLAAKKTVDDRALNVPVWRALAQTLAARPFTRILEIGTGIGTMIERLAENGLLGNTAVIGIDSNVANIAQAQQRLAHLDDVQLVAIDLFDFVAQQQGQPPYDLLIAHAFLDLMDIAATLPQLFSLLSPGGHFYFTINFDGATILQPTIDADFDALVERLYHQTMDERVVNGRLSGDSQSGRHLFGHIRAAGGEIVAAGSSDWVVFAGADGYPADEAAFLHFIVDTMAQALNGRSPLDAARFADWIALRHAQIERGELVYIAHQIDFFGRLNA